MLIVYNMHVMSFKAINLSEKMIKSLTRQGYFSPSPIQLRVIPRALKGETLMVQSATGSGKTHSFLIPVIENIDLKNQVTQTLIIAPTRELARQIYEFAYKFVNEYKELKISLFISGREKEKTIQGLSIAPHIIIGTPGRILDVLKENVLSLRNVNTVVLDEADMMLKEGHFAEVVEITSYLSVKPQYLVFSATLEHNLKVELSKFVGVNLDIVNEDVLTSKNVTHYLIDIKHNDYLEATRDFIRQYNPYLLLIFASTKEKAKEVYVYLKEEGCKVGLLTGDLSSRERKSIMKMVKNENIYILVCSDVASRGLDIEDVSDVLNVDLPNNLEFYFHRAGRTGRFDKKGNCYSFFNNDSISKPLELLSHGVAFTYLSLKDHTFVEGKPIEKKHPTKSKLDPELSKEIKKINAMSKGKNKKVKPGYKKKVKDDIAKAKQKHRREMIKKDIRRQRVERYKREHNNG